jgi:hypothetical protein
MKAKNDRWGEPATTGNILPYGIKALASGTGGVRGVCQYRDNQQPISTG